jgi:hypothetical protein
VFRIFIGNCFGVVGEQVVQHWFTGVMFVIFELGADSPDFS